MGSFISDLQKTIHAPFSGQMDLFQLFLAIGIVLVMVGLWTIILMHLRRDLE